MAHIGPTYLMLGYFDLLGDGSTNGRGQSMYGGASWRLILMVYHSILYSSMVS